jgi:hypothetical protein
MPPGSLAVICCECQDSASEMCLFNLQTSRFILGLDLEFCKNDCYELARAAGLQH